MLTFFLVGTFWFWALLIVSFIAITCLSEEAAPGWATAVAIGTGLLLQFFGGVPIFSWLRHNPKEFLLSLVGYLLAGVLYSIVKWTSFIKKKAKSDFAYSKTPDKVKVDEHSDRIIGWMAFWPCNAAWTLLNDPIRWAFETIFDKTKALFQRIADKAYQSVEQKQK
jgi:hypothetical protein